MFPRPRAALDGSTLSPSVLARFISGRGRKSSSSLVDASPARGRGATGAGAAARAMPSRGSDVSMVRADDGAPWLLGCVVTTKTATCLVNATVRDPPGGPVRVRQLCGMLTALHSLAGGIAEPVSFLALSRFSVGLWSPATDTSSPCSPTPGAHRESVSELARVVARAFARAGGSDLPDLIHADTLDAEERADAHTVHDDLADSSDEPRTWDRFASFHDEFLVPALETASAATPLARTRRRAPGHPPRARSHPRGRRNVAERSARNRIAGRTDERDEGERDEVESLRRTTRLAALALGPARFGPRSNVTPPRSSPPPPIETETETAPTPRLTRRCSV